MEKVCLKERRRRREWDRDIYIERVWVSDIQRETERDRKWEKVRETERDRKKCEGVSERNERERDSAVCLSLCLCLKAYESEIEKGTQQALHNSM